MLEKSLKFGLKGAIKLEKTAKITKIIVIKSIILFRIVSLIN